MISSPQKPALKRLTIILLLVAAPAFAQQVGPGGVPGTGGSGAPTTCAAGTYACLNLANTFTGTQTAPSFVSPGDGVHAGYSNWVGNTANPAVVANTYGIMGPAEATYTAWAEQPANSTSGGPTAGQVKVYGAPVANVSQWTLATLGAAATLAPATSFTVPLPQAQANSGTALTAANAVNWQPFLVPPQGLTFSHLAFGVNTIDATTTDHYDVCLWNASGTLIADTGALAGGGSVWGVLYQHDVPTVQGSLTIPGGLYFIGWTGSATTAELSVQQGPGNYTLSLYGAGPTNTTTGGACGNVTIPAPTLTQNDTGIGYEGMNAILH